MAEYDAAKVIAQIDSQVDLFGRVIDRAAEHGRSVDGSVGQFTVIMLAEIGKALAVIAENTGHMPQRNLSWHEIETEYNATMPRTEE